MCVRRFQSDASAYVVCLLHAVVHVVRFFSICWGHNGLRRGTSAVEDPFAFTGMLLAVSGFSARCIGGMRGSKLNHGPATACAV